LSVIEDEPSTSRPRLDSCPEGAKAGPSKPPKSLKPISILSRNADFLRGPVEHLEPPVSPIPLPAGVICLDPDNDGTRLYGSDIVNYLRHKEIAFHRSVKTGYYFDQSFTDRGLSETCWFFIFYSN
jgi:hypothetical protein